jgi:hypothetical protein
MPRDIASSVVNSFRTPVAPSRLVRVSRRELAANAVDHDAKPATVETS